MLSLYPIPRLLVALARPLVRVADRCVRLYGDGPKTLAARLSREPLYRVYVGGHWQLCRLPVSNVPFRARIYWVPRPTRFSPHPEGTFIWEHHP